MTCNLVFNLASGSPFCSSDHDEITLNLNMPSLTLGDTGDHKDVYLASIGSNGALCDVNNTEATAGYFN